MLLRAPRVPAMGLAHTDLWCGTGRLQCLRGAGAVQKPEGRAGSSLGGIWNIPFKKVKLSVWLRWVRTRPGRVGAMPPPPG